MSSDISSSWRGVVGLVKPTYRPGSLEEMIRLLPEGIGVIPLFLGIKTGEEKERLNALESVKEKIAELAKLKVDLIFPQGAGLFMLRGYKEAGEIVRSLEEKHGIPILTSAMTLVESFNALGIKRIVIVGYIKGEMNQKYEQYLNDAGFEVLGMDAISVPFAEVGRLSYREVYAFSKNLYLKYNRAQGICLLGAGWRVLEAVPLLEQDLQVPVVHQTTAHVWAIQKRFHVRQPVKGCGRLLEEMP